MRNLAGRRLRPLLPQMAGNLRSRGDLVAGLRNSNLGLAYLRAGEPAGAVPRPTRPRVRRRLSASRSRSPKPLTILAPPTAMRTAFRKAWALTGRRRPVPGRPVAYGEGLAMDGSEIALREAGRPEDAIAAHRRAVEAFQDTRNQLGEGCGELRAHRAELLGACFRTPTSNARSPSSKRSGRGEATKAPREWLETSGTPHNTRRQAVSGQGRPGSH